MTAQDRDLVLALRAELAAIDPARACDRRALAIGVGRADTSRDPVLGRLAVRLRLGGAGGGSGGVAGGGSGATAPGLGATAAGSGTTAPGSGTTAPGSGTTAPGVAGDAAFDWDRARDHCRASYLRGLFLSRGSLSLANGRTHLEFVLDPADAPRLAARLVEEGLPAAWRVRRGRGVVTWKSAETVVTFLRRAGAGAALLELEARQVSRAMTGDLNRVINAESANLTRAVEASGRSLAAIEALTADGRLAAQPYVVRAVAEARRRSPESTLAELAEGLRLHRSAVQRALERIERLALHDDADAGRRASPAGRAGRSA